jgi:quinol monooxygenase YgiN
MPYVRISLMVPRSGRGTRAGQLLDAVAHYCEGQPGFLKGYRLEQSDNSGLIGRVTVWTDERSADAVAQTDRMLALRAALNEVVRKGSHQERGFWAYDTSAPSEASGRGAGTELTVDDVVRSAERIVSRGV